MTPKEAQSIRLLSLEHTRRSRADYFRQTATEKGYNPIIFWSDLNEAFMRIHDYVNTNLNAWETGKNGERIYLKETLNLFYETDGQVVGFVSNAAYGKSGGIVQEFGLLDLLEPLYFYGQSIINEEVNKSNELFEQIEYLAHKYRGTLKFPPEPTNAQKAVFLHYLIRMGFEDKITGKAAMTDACNKHEFGGSPDSIYVEYKRIATPKPDKKHPDPLTEKNALYICRYMLNKYPEVKARIVKDFPTIQDEIE